MTLKLVSDEGNVEKLEIRNLMDIPSMARGFAEDIEAEVYGNVERAILIVDSEDGLRILGWGDSVSQYEAIGILEAAKIMSFQSNFEE